MAEVGELNVTIGAVTGGLEKGLAKARSGIAGFSRGLKSVAGTVGIATAAISAATVGLAALTNASAQAAREIQNLSRVAGASPTKFQGMAFAAKSVGIEQEKLSDILKDTQDRIGDFLQTGGGPMADFFETIAPKIGMTAEQFRSLSGPDALQKFYSGLQQSNLSLSEQIFHMEALSGESSRLIPLLRDGGVGFAALADQANNLGVVMSGIEIEALSQTADATSKVGEMFSAAGDEIALRFSPFIQQAAKNITDLVSKAGGIDKIIGGAFQKAAGVVGFFADAIGVVIAAVDKMADAFRNAINAIIKAINSVADKIPGIDAKLQEIDPGFISRRFEDMANLTTQHFDRMSNGFDMLNVAMKDFLGGELPSDNLDAWLAKQKAVTMEAAENAVQAQNAMAAAAGGMGGRPSSDFESSAEQERSEQERVQMDEELERFRESLRTREESEIESHARRNEELMAFLEYRLLTEQEYNKLKEEEESRHQGVLTDIQEAEAKKREQAEQEEMQKRLAQRQKFLSDIVNSTNTKNKALFKIQKAAAIAEALISARKSVVAAYEYGSSIGGPPVASAFAAIAAAAQAANIASIASTSFGGGGGGVSSGGGGGSGGGQAALAQNSQQQQQGRALSRLDVTLSGVSSEQMFSGAQIRGLINRINDELDDGAVLGNLRFAQ